MDFFVINASLKKAEKNISFKKNGPRAKKVLDKKLAGTKEEAEFENF
jgi:hypothetical protein